MIHKMFGYKRIIILIVLMSVILSGCGDNTVSSGISTDETASTVTESEPPKKTEQELRLERVNLIMQDMTLEQKIGQLFIVQPEALVSRSGSVTKFSDEIAETFKTYPAGGVILFGANVVSPDQLTAFTSALNSLDGIPLFVSIDEEGGQVARIANNDNFDVKTYSSMEAVGKSNDPDAAYEVGKTIGTYLKEYGFNLDFAPVADVNTNPENRVIGNRAFGSNPESVSKMVNGAILGFQSQNIMTCIKHFPGHGDTKGDTHDGYVSVTKTWEMMKNCELIPFINALDLTDMVMAAHVTATNVTSDGLPATLSYEMLTGKLRNELGYDGVIITDSLSMGAIKKNYSSAEASLKAFNAGADILLMPENFEESFNAILNAVKNGEISEERLNKSVERILCLKDKYIIK